MKNLLIYISPTGSFENKRTDLENDAGVLSNIQIDNSLDLGWKPEDILFVTNFEFEYRGIKALKINDVEFFNRKPQASKINVIVKLFKSGLIENEKLYWFHDLDAFQLHPFTESEIELNDEDLALTDYGSLPRWSTGTIFFKKSSEDIFDLIKVAMYKYNMDEEWSLGTLTEDDENIRKRVKKINKSYNFNSPNLRSGYKKAVKPLRVAHFHPFVEIDGLRSFDFFKGKNKLNTPLITERLIQIFNQNGIV